MNVIVELINAFVGLICTFISIIVDTLNSLFAIILSEKVLFITLISFLFFKCIFKIFFKVRVEEKLEDNEVN